MGGKVAVKDLCVRCEAETEYDVNTPITVRHYYIEGAGQLCEACWNKLWPTHAEEDDKTEQKEKGSQ